MQKLILVVHDKQACGEGNDEPVEVEAGTSLNVFVLQDIVDVSETDSNCKICCQQDISLLVMKTQEGRCASTVDFTVSA